MRVAAWRALALAVILACGGPVRAAEDKAARFYEDAVTRLDRKDVAGALIQLRNAVKEDPRMVSAHVLLGRTYLDNFQPDAAQESLETALRLGADRTQVAVPLARALLAQSRTAELLERLPVEAASAAERHELMVLRGEAMRQQGNREGALQVFREVLSQDPRQVSALVAITNALTREGKFGEAARYADQAVEIAPGNPQAWYHRGTVSHAAGNVARALTAYDKALSLEPKLNDARIARAGLLLDAGRDRDAAADLDLLKKETPREPRAGYLRAIYLTRVGDTEGARKSFTEITDTLDPIPVEALRARAPELLMIGALAHRALQQDEKAQRYLDQVLVVDPSNAGARKLLATILIGRKDFTRAIDVLESGRRYASRDPQLLALLGTAYMGVGKNQIAARVLEDAMQSGAALPEVNASLGFSLIENGQRELGIDYLRRAFDRDPTQGRIGVALAVMYMRQGDAKQALAVAEQASKRLPADAAVANLLGAVRAAAGDRAGARKAYEKALAIDAAFTPAHFNLGRLEVSEGDFERARKRFGAIIKARPKDTSAMFEMGVLEVAAKRPEEAARWLEKLRSLDSRHVRGALLLAEVYVSLGQPQNALDAARSAQAAAPESPETQAALARALVATGDVKAAQAIVARMSRVAGSDPGRHYQVALLQLQSGNPAGASSSLDKALALQPQFLPARVLQVEIDLAEGRLDQAESRARALARDLPASAEGSRLSADVAMRRGRAADAIAGYRAALARDPSTVNAVRLFQGFARAGQLTEGVALLEGWTRERPRDAVAQRALAEGYLRAGRFDKARERYEIVLALTGEDSQLLNNLAVVEDRLGNGKAAVARAERARALAPGDPLVLDTLGWLLVRQGAVEVGLKHLREAKVRAPGNPEVRYHLAAALAKAGRKAEAREELADLLKGPAEFEGLEDAKALRQALERS